MINLRALLEKDEADPGGAPFAPRGTIKSIIEPSAEGMNICKQPQPGKRIYGKWPPRANPTIQW